MIMQRVWPIILLMGVSASAATLPLKPGAFVLAGVSCRDPAFAAMFTYDGRQFSYPHATACRSIIRSHVGRDYQVRETCSALGDGTPAKPTTSVAAYKILSSVAVRVSRNGKPAASYRWCPGDGKSGSIPRAE